MSIPPELMEKLACPGCRGELSLAEDGAAIHCASCSLRFAIEDGIPNLLLDEATPLENTGSPQS